MNKQTASGTIETLAVAGATAAAVILTIATSALVIGPTSIARTSAGAFAAGFAAVLAGATAVFFWRSWRARRKVVPGQSIENRLERASNALRDASYVMSQVEKELRTRQAKLEALTAEYEDAQALAKVDQKAADALRNALANVVKGEGTRDAVHSGGVLVRRS